MRWRSDCLGSPVHRTATDATLNRRADLASRAIPPRRLRRGLSRESGEAFLFVICIIFGYIDPAVTYFSL